MLNIDDRLIKEVSAKIKPNGLSVLLAIAIHYNNKSKLSFPSHKRLMELTGLGSESIYSALKTLRAEGLLTVHQYIDLRTKKFGQRTFKLSTRFIKIFVDVEDAEGLEEVEPLAAFPETAKPDAGKQQTQLINNIEHSVASATERAPSKGVNGKQGVQRGAADPGSELGYDFEKFWNEYDFKKGSKKNALAKWVRLNADEIKQIQATLETYKRETVVSDAGRDKNDFKPMRKHPEFYLSAKTWEAYTELTSIPTEPTPYDELYNEYITWVGNYFPSLITSVRYFSKAQYIAVKTHAYKPGSRNIGDTSLKFLLKKGHEICANSVDGGDVYSQYCKLIDERLKAHSV